MLKLLFSGFPPERDGQDGELIAVWYWEKRYIGDFTQGSGEPDTWNICIQAANVSGGVGGVETYL